MDIDGLFSVFDAILSPSLTRYSSAFWAEAVLIVKTDFFFFFFKDLPFLLDVNVSDTKEHNFPRSPPGKSP